MPTPAARATSATLASSPFSSKTWPAATSRRSRFFWASLRIGRLRVARRRPAPRVRRARIRRFHSAYPRGRSGAVGPLRPAFLGHPAAVRGPPWRAMTSRPSGRGVPGPSTEIRPRSGARTGWVDCCSVVSVDGGRRRDALLRLIQDLLRRYFDIDYARCDAPDRSADFYDLTHVVSVRRRLTSPHASRRDLLDFDPHTHTERGDRVETCCRCAGRRRADAPGRPGAAAEPDPVLPGRLAALRALRRRMQPAPFAASRPRDARVWSRSPCVRTR